MDKLHHHDALIFDIRKRANDLIFKINNFLEFSKKYLYAEDCSIVSDIESLQTICAYAEKIIIPDEKRSFVVESLEAVACSIKKEVTKVEVNSRIAISIINRLIVSI